MKNTINYILMCCFLAVGISLTPQTSHAQSEVVQVQPMIMVVPHAKEGDTLRTELEKDINLRVAIAKVKEGFDNRGFTTIDYVAKLKAMQLDEVFTSTDATDVKSQLIAASGADIYVEVEAYSHKGSNGNSARVILEAYDAFTGRALGSKTVSSNYMYVGDFSRLVEQALNKKDKTTQISTIEDFLNVMQTKFDDMRENGRVVKVIFTLDNNSWYDFDSETTDGDFLSDAIEDWFYENAFKNNYSDLRITGNRIYVDEVRIPLRDERNRNYRPSLFAREIRSFIRKVQLDDDPDTRLGIDRDVRGGTIYISMN
ncbi:MAG: DUF6175 family protein [Bacteroidota bacterium]